MMKGSKTEINLVSHAKKLNNFDRVVTLSGTLPKSVKCLVRQNRPVKSVTFGALCPGIKSICHKETVVDAKERH